MAAIAVGALVWHRPERGPTPQPQLSEVPPALSSEPETPPPLTKPPAPAPEPERTAVEDAPRENWNEQYLATDDYFAFVAAAAPAAIGGDGRAQYLISRALLACQVQLLKEKEPPRYARPNTPRLCERFYGGHPLDAFDLPAEAKSFTYWRDEALANRDALAVVADSLTTLGKYEAARDPAMKEQLRSQFLGGIRVVVESRDPEAIMSISTFALQPAMAREPWQWGAWLVAACELGLDCSKPFPGLARACATSQSCVGLQTVADMIQTAPYPTAAYTAGQDIAYKIKIGDWEGLQPHLALRD